ncbi:MAG: hypothetical protein N2Z74_10425, partial [Syntrophales bacterium]|nr:hypothetical protein [Syntrophales bacterium]
TGDSAVVVFEKAISYGYEGALCSEIKAALYGTGENIPIHNYIVGLGGRDVKAAELVGAVQEALAAGGDNRVFRYPTWLNCHTE